MEFMSYVKEKAKILSLDPSLLTRPVNEGFSGGEKKRNEIFQMAVLEPALAVLDETDSGLDIDALKTVADGVNAMRSPTRSTIVVTHYQRLLNYIVPISSTSCRTAASSDPARRTWRFSSKKKATAGWKLNRN
jgi:Fe-S cluster assembly ATP-binding protein